MKTATTRKLKVKKETLRSISMRDLAGAAGGTLPAAPGFIMKDSIIVRTSGR